ncbi:hypothetical protein PHMEG_0006665 [Phytophthora megakarya]|uniref:Eukaryotic/viral aspartic protease n=1 Tax=Phytophthora megakarya TaxID=4795 RepID=A0A225WNM2_9STRA|nr:hypothetical protein PHMEG_0006665 [Phytophthora megakarya]
MDILPGESRGYWKHHSPRKWFRQAKITSKIHNDKAILHLGTGAEVSIVNTIFARKGGTVENGDKVYRTEGRIQIKMTLAGSLVYFCDIWVDDLTGQQAILGMDFMVPARIRLDLAHGSIRLPDEVRIQLSGRRQLYSDKAKIVNVGQYLRGVGRTAIAPEIVDPRQTVGHTWGSIGADNIRPIREDEVHLDQDEVLILHQDQRIGIWLTGDHVPRLLGVISIGSRRYMEWQNLALDTTTDVRFEDMEFEALPGPAVERSECLRRYRGINLRLLFLDLPLSLCMQ